MNRPITNINSSQDSALLESKGAIPRGCAHGLAVVSEVPVGPGILGLILQKNPADVARFVISVVVDAINRVKRARLCSDVREERNKSTSTVPFWTNFYPATAVVFVALNIGIVAPASDVRPCGVFGALSLFPVSSPVAMFCHGLENPFFVIAPTRDRPSSSEFGSLDFFLGSAVAYTPPHNPTDFARANPKNDQATESLPGNIFSDLFHNAVIPNTRSSRVVLETVKLREHRLSGYPPIQRNKATASVETVNT